MTRTQYKENLKEELVLMDRDELKAYAKKNGIRLYTTVPDKMVQVIADTMTSREYHGDAFRTNPMDVDDEKIAEEAKHYEAVHDDIVQSISDSMKRQELRKQYNVPVQGGVCLGLPNHVDDIEKMFMKGVPNI